MTEKPLDRLNYFNGQRLEASDLKTEQDYHIRVRRWLNKSLYSAGIAAGLTVRAVDNEPAVWVGPGLALDALGREIILYEEEKVPFSATERPRATPRGPADLDGLYLTIRYDEEVTSVDRSACEPVGGTPGNQAGWGGPTRVRARARFAWRDYVPPESSGEVLLALVTLNATCSEVSRVDPSDRHYVGAASASRVRQYALDGEKHVNKENPARIYFHIRGRQPNSVTLYLRAEQFSTFHYTELGAHSHLIKLGANGLDIGVTLDPLSIPPHHHEIEGDTGLEDAHSHELDYIQAYKSGVALVHDKVGFYLADVAQGRGSPDNYAIVSGWTDMTFVLKGGSSHKHSRAGDTKSYVLADALPLRGVLGGKGASDPAGAKAAARPTDVDPLSFVHAVRVRIGRSSVQPLSDVTESILRQVQVARGPAETWTTLGDSTGGHPLAKSGTGPIRLDFLPSVSFEEGEYVIELNVENDSGGKILYNLYVE